MEEVFWRGLGVTVFRRVSVHARSLRSSGDPPQLPGVEVGMLEDEHEHSTISLIHRLGRQLDGAPSRLLAILESKLKSWTEEAPHH